MTVKELREKLSQYDDNLEVVYGYEHALFSILPDDIDTKPTTCKRIFTTRRCEVSTGPESFPALVLHR